MNLTTIVNKVKSKIPWGQFANTPSGAVSSMTDLLHAANVYSSQLVDNQATSDALLVAMSDSRAMAESILDAASQTAIDSDVGKLQQTEIEIDADEVETIMGGFKQACDLTNDTLDHVDLTLSDANGEVYHFVSESYDQLDSAESVLKVECENGYSDVITRVSAVGEQPKYKLSGFLPSLRCVKPFTPHAQDSVAWYLRGVKAMATGDDTDATISSMISDIGSALSVVFSSDDIVTRLTELCSARSIIPDSTVFGMCKQLFDSFSKIHKIGYRTHIFSLYKNLVDSVSINEQIITTVDAIKGSRLSVFVSSTHADISTKSKAVKTYLTNLRNAFSRGGLRAAILYVLGYGKTISGMTDSDGVMVYTDNNGLKPREFIAGLVGTLVTTVVQAVAMVIAIFAHVIGVILAVLGAIGSSIIKSITSTYSETNARMNDDSTDGVDVSVLPTVPFALFQKEVSLNETGGSWYANMYFAGMSVCKISVPGGLLFVGPGSFRTNSDGTPNPDRLPATIRIEFHPFSVAVRHEHARLDDYDLFLIKSLVYAYSSPQPTYGINLYRMATLSGSLQANDTIVDIINRCWVHDAALLSQPVNNGSGYLSNDDDQDARTGVGLMIAYFLTWAISLSSHTAYGKTNWMAWVNNVFMGNWGNYDVAGFLFGNEDWNGYSCRFDTVMKGVWNALSHDNNEAPSWDDLLVFAQFTCTSADVTSSDYDEARPFVGDWSTSHIVVGMLFPNDHAIVTYWKLAEYVPEQCVDQCSDTATGSDVFFVNQPSSVDKISYALILPTYNKTTYWLWVAIGAGALVVVSVAAALLTIRTSKKIRAKRANNVRRFNKMQDEYKDAAHGNFWKRDADGNIIYGSDNKPEIEHVTPGSNEWAIRDNEVFARYKKTVLVNNLQAAVIGGSRYDYSTFWGEAVDTGDDESGSDSVYSTLAEVGEEDSADSLSAVTNFEDVVRRALGTDL